MNFLEIMKDKSHPEHEDMMEWFGEDFEPEYFDLKKTNGELRFIIKTKNWNPN